MGLPAAPVPRVAAPERQGDAAPARPIEAEPDLCVHQRRADLGAPAHRERDGEGGFVRLSECTRLRRIEGDDRWLRVAFPEVEGRTEGWISGRYVMDCGPCTAPGASAGGASPDGAQWPPQPQGMCLEAGASGREGLSVAPVRDRAQARGGARGRAGARVTVVSYNVWELYDGMGEDRYLAARPGGTPAVQYEGRMRAASRALRAVEADVLVLQEIEGAAVACSLAERAWPGSGWTCFASSGRPGQLPQNVAVATRLEATARTLTPSSPREAGPRPALELTVEGAGGLTATAVHLKSSRGRSGHDDCAAARERMGMAAALAKRYEGWSSVLVLGDFNVDPSDEARAIYDRTDDILEGRGFARLCPPGRLGCRTPTYVAASRGGSTIDLAFFRSGGRWRPAGVRVLSTAPVRPREPFGSDHLPLVVELALAGAAEPAPR